MNTALILLACYLLIGVICFILFADDTVATPLDVALFICLFLWPVIVYITMRDMFIEEKNNDTK
jgi:hypothetical protein